MTTKTKKSPLLLRIVSAWPRLFLSILAGFAVGALLPLYVTELRGVTRFLVAWDFGVGLYLILAFRMIAHSGVREIHRHIWPRTHEHLLAHLRLIIAVIDGIGLWKFAPMFIRIEAGIPRLLVAWNVAGRHGPNPGSYAPLYALLIDDHGVVVLVHLVFALYYYAHEFHSEAQGASPGSGGGLQFSGERVPDYLDFVDRAFVVGTTAQTSDVEVCSRKMRRIVTLHGLLSFFFNTTVIALGVNLTSQLAG